MKDLRFLFFPASALDVFNVLGASVLLAKCLILPASHHQTGLLLSIKTDEPERSSYDVNLGFPPASRAKGICEAIKVDVLKIAVLNRYDLAVALYILSGGFLALGGDRDFVNVVTVVEIYAVNFKLHDDFLSGRSACRVFGLALLSVLTIARGDRVCQAGKCIFVALHKSGG